MIKTGYQLKSLGKVSLERGFQVQLDKEYKDALIGLEGFSYVQVIWWAHELDKEDLRSITKLEKPYKKGPDILGIFATRSPLRPNPIAVTNAMVLGIDAENGLLNLAYLDAQEGTPVLDIKPYHPATERIKDVKVPHWCRHWPQWFEESAEFDWAGEFENAR